MNITAFTYSLLAQCVHAVSLNIGVTVGLEIEPMLHRSSGKLVLKMSLKCVRMEQARVRHSCRQTLAETGVTSHCRPL